MPATVKSLEERIDEMAEDFSSVKTRLAQVAEGQGHMQSLLAGLASSMGQMQGQLATNQAQLAVVVARLDSTIEELRLTRSRLDGLLTNSAAFQSKAELSFAMIRWTAIFAAGLLVTWIASAFALVRTAGSWEATTQHHQKSIDEIRHEMRELQGKPK